MRYCNVLLIMPNHGFPRHIAGKAKRSEITVFVRESDGT